MEETLKPFPDSVPVAIVGAGLAGLACGRALSRAGREVHVFEAASEIGGRMRTEVHREGFRLDVGFHVLLTGYPAVRRELDIGKLDLGVIEPGCVVARKGKLYPLSDSMDLLRLPFATLGDKLRLGRLRSAGRDRTPERATMEHLRALGFSQKLIDALFVPLFGGVFLDRSLSNSARYFESLARSFLAGAVGIPARGIGAVPHQIAEGIPAEAIHTGCPDESLSLEAGRLRGLTVRGQEVRADALVLATGAAEAARLSGLPLPEFQSLGTTVVYFTTTRPPTDEKRLFFRADPEGWTNHFAVLTNIAPALAPAGQHLLMGTILGVPEMHEGAISEKIRQEMAYWFPHAGTHAWRWLRTYKMPNAQWAFPPGLAARLPQTRTPIGGLYLAGDYTREPSVEGALGSGTDAAEALLGG